MSFSKSFRNKITVILVNLVTVVVLLGGCEALCEFLLRRPQFIPAAFTPAFQDYYRSQDRNIIQVTDCGQYDEGLFYTLSPGECSFQNREFDTKLYVNEAGVRDVADDLISPDVIVLGDSYAMGWGVNQKESFPEVLESSLNGQKVLNLGISSYGTVRELKILERLVTTGPGHVVIQYHSTDYDENLEYHLQENELTISPRTTYDSLKQYIKERNRYYPGKHISSLIKHLIHQRQPQDVDPKMEAEVFLNALLNTSFALDSIQLTVFEVDHISTIDNEFIYALEELINTNEDYPTFLRNLNILPVSSYMEPDDFFILDGHLNANGHKKMAELLINSITKSN